jgi:hypothetical protein
VPPLAHPRELSHSEIAALIMDMRAEAQDKRRVATDPGFMPTTRTMYMAEALIIEHWANRLEALLQPIEG